MKRVLLVDEKDMVVLMSALVFYQIHNYPSEIMNKKIMLLREELLGIAKEIVKERGKKVKK